MEQERPTSGILEQALQCRPCARREATHFVLCKGGKMRFLMALRGGEARLTRSLVAYGGKLALLMKLLRLLPYRLLAAAHMGYFARASLHPAIAAMVPEGHEWNMLVGTYWPKQKLVLQCFRKGEPLCAFVKVGNAASAAEMHTEMDFLAAPHRFRLIELPEVLAMRRAAVDCPFDILVTREFRGDKAEPVLTEDIYRVYQELSADRREENGQTLALSHGDFAPWNIRRHGDRYIVFDWESCAYRPAGHDIVHFLTAVYTNLHGLPLQAAVSRAVADIRAYEPDFAIDEAAFAKAYLEIMQL